MSVRGAWIYRGFVKDESMKAQLIKLSLLAAAAAASPAFAGPIYAGFGLGQSSVHVDCTGTVTCHDTDYSLKLMGGYRFSNTLSVEGGWIKFGHGKTATATTSYSVEPKAFFAAGAVRMEFMPSWSGIARLGLAQMHTTTEQVASGVVTLTSNTKFKPIWGLAVNYALDESASVEFGWDASKSEAASGAGQRVHLWSGSLLYSF